MLTVIEVIKKTSGFFSSRGIESPRLNAELLVGHALGLPRMRLYIEFERPVSEAELGTVRELVRRRGRREPLQHILGFTEFCGLRLKTDGRALIPRPETELLVETVTARCSRPPARILDLGTGSGAIALALARAFPGARVTAVDAVREALLLAAENAESTGLAGRVSLVESDWFQGLPAGETFDLIVSNPPYLSADEAAAAAPEVRDHEPGRALTAADGGFADIERIVAGAPGALAPGGMLALETGIGHRARLAAALKRAGFERTEPFVDLTGRDRFFLAWR
ncbi:MAG TPA: peptide chain release factor N(5)-glutamine methyltransferase [Opitutaceae bacterium]|nr:peptide chain release factor N(5)-glutamine methyltransferase [Opitutaceae bacterium]